MPTTRKLKHDARPEIDVDAWNADANEQIYQALVAGKADIVINENGVLIWTYDGHFWELNDNWAHRSYCLGTYARFMRNGKPSDLPKKLGKEFVEQALSEGEDWFKHAYRGPCPKCAEQRGR
jgi:hypothetical protein